MADCLGRSGQFVIEMSHIRLRIIEMAKRKVENYLQKIGFKVCLASYASSSPFFIQSVMNW